MNYKIGNKVTMQDGSYSFGIQDGRYSSIGGIDTRVLTVIRTGLTVTERVDGTRNGIYCTINDLLVTDGHCNFFFVQSRFIKPVDKKIEVRYFCDGQDITNSISDETKRNLRL